MLFGVILGLLVLGPLSLGLSRPTTLAGRVARRDYITERLRSPALAEVLTGVAVILLSRLRDVYNRIGGGAEQPGDCDQGTEPPESASNSILHTSPCFGISIIDFVNNCEQFLEPRWISLALSETPGVVFALKLGAGI